MSVYLDELTGKAYKKIKKAKKYTLKWVLADKGDTKFTQVDAGIVNFTNYTQAANGKVYSRTGSFTYNKKGIVTQYAELALTSQVDKSYPNLFYLVNVVGKNGFKKHAKAADRRDNEISKQIGGSLGPEDAQTIANWLDSLPGADKFDSFSTSVFIGDSGLYFA